MWIAVAVIVLSTWIFFATRARSLAKTVDRGEVMVLKPLGITYLVFTVAFATFGDWFGAGFCAAAALLNGMIGASLHKSRSFAELVEGTDNFMQKGPALPLSDAEAMQWGRVIHRASMIVGLLILALLLRHSIRWYFAIPAAFVSSFLFMFCSGLLVAFQGKPAPPGAPTA